MKQAMAKLQGGDALKNSYKNSYGLNLVLLLLVAAVVIAAGIGLRSPWPADEPRFVEVAREMVQSGQWLFPMRGGELYPDKPPVFMWAIALFYWLTDDLKLAFLLPNALCGLITLALVFDLGARWHSVRLGRTAALLLLIVPQFLIQVKNAQIDAMVMCWITLGCYGLLRHFLFGANWRWYFIGCGFMGLGVITKGVGFLPMLLLLPLAFVFFLNARAGKEGGSLPQASAVWQRQAWLGLVVMLGVIGCWLFPMLVSVWFSQDPQYQAYMNNILFKQTGERYLNAWHHLKPWFYYLTSVIPVFWFPLPLLLLAYWREFWAALRQQPMVLVLSIWVLLVVVFFSVSTGKRGVYILPALPMLCLVCSYLLISATTAQSQRLKQGVSLVIQGCCWGLGALFLTVGLLAIIELPWLVAKVGQPDLALAQLGQLLVCIGLFWFLLLIIHRVSADKGTRFYGAGTYGVALYGIALYGSWLMFATWGYPLLEPIRTPQRLLMQAKALIPANSELGLVQFKEQFILFSPFTVTHFSYLAPVEEQERNAWLWMQELEQEPEQQAQTPRYLLIAKDTPLHCVNLEQGQALGKAHRRHWYLISQSQLLENCPAPEKVVRYITLNPNAWQQEKNKTAGF